MRVVLFLLGLIAFSSSAQNADSLYNEGVKLHDSGEYLRAVEKYQQALLLVPNSGNLYYEIAFSYHSLKDYKNALINADKALEFATGDTKRLAGIVKGSVLDDMGDPEASIEFYSKILNDYPNDYLLLYNYGLSCAHAGKRKDAEEALIKAIDAKPSHPSSNLQLAYWKRDDGENVRAVLGVYFFLLTENKSQRAKVALSKLKTWISGDVKKDDGKPTTITVTLPAEGKKDEQMSAAELFLSLLPMTSNEINKAKKAKGDTLSETPEQNFISQTEKFFSMMGDLSEKRKPS